MRKIRRPLTPAFEFLSSPEGIEENEVVKPPTIFFSETLKPIARHRPEAVRRKFRPASNNSGIFWAKIRPYSTGTGSRRQSEIGVELGSINPAMLGEAIETDQEGISGKGGCGGVRRVPVAERPQGQNLPNSLAGGSEKIDKLVGGWAKITNAAEGRQRRGM